MLQEIFDNTAHYEYIPHLRLSNGILYSYLRAFNPHQRKCKPAPFYLNLYECISSHWILL